eukprot:1158743-Pelagomonas_calceolata.AAC.36
MRKSSKIVSSCGKGGRAGLREHIKEHSWECRRVATQAFWHVSALRRSRPLAIPILIQTTGHHSIQLCVILSTSRLQEYSGIVEKNA